ncbi:unnamed protein product [Protopolystoma xenopodis]|uniref:Uncharacterized protein n=1 Tax=Protopolystoma xenopodis TaxID=117903 RepID=A0A3S5A6W6_9PLAT|nr:unnamed protein product [Protopolystoma xenopodis]
MTGFHNLARDGSCVETERLNDLPNRNLPICPIAPFQLRGGRIKVSPSACLFSVALAVHPLVCLSANPSVLAYCWGPGVPQCLTTLRPPLRPQQPKPYGRQVAEMRRVGATVCIAHFGRLSGCVSGRSMWGTGTGDRLDFNSNWKMRCARCSGLFLSSRTSVHYRGEAA